MSLIVSEVYDALIEAGSSVEKARAAAAAIPVKKDMATKEDIVDIRQDIATIKQVMATKEDVARIDNDIAAIRQEIAAIKQMMATKEDIARLDRRIAVLNFAVFSFGPAILGLLVKLTFFP